MSQELYSVEEVADRLGLHVRTVRNYVRAGRLKAVRIGKQYRIARDDLEVLTGHPMPEREPTRRHRHVEVTSVIDIDAISGETANRMTTLLMGAANGRREGDERLRIQTTYDEERAHMKVILIGGLKTNAEFFKIVGALLER
jgi:excisionase family DNA binding protein